jgi:hypothetical protein
VTTGNETAHYILTSTTWSGVIDIISSIFDYNIATASD